MTQEIVDDLVICLLALNAKQVETISEIGGEDLEWIDRLSGPTGRSYRRDIEQSIAAKGFRPRLTLGTV